MSGTSIGGLVVLILIFYLLRKRKAHKGQRKSNKTYNAELYATVFVYEKEPAKDGYHSHTPTYTITSEFYDGEYVVVNYKGQLCAGRIVGIYADRPEEIPANVTIKPVLKRLTKSDLKRVANYGSILKGVLEKKPL